jgi:hypothetical protein
MIRNLSIQIFENGVAIEPSNRTAHALLMICYCSYVIIFNCLVQIFICR